MKEKILAALRAKYNSMGYSAKALDAVAAQLETTVTEEGQIEAAVSGVEGLLKIFQSEIDTRVAAAKKPEEKKPESQPANENAKPDANPADDTPAWAKSLMETNQKLAEEIAAIKSGKTTETRKSQLEAKLKDAPETFKTATLKAYGRMQFKDDADFDGFLTEIEEEAKTVIQAEADSGLGGMSRPVKTAGGGAGKASKEEVDALVSKLPI